jgi:type IV pilus assembly protein PilY1
MKHLNKFSLRGVTAVLALLATASFFVYKVVSAQGAPATVDFSNGPLVTQKTPANVVLALSVEFPTSGRAYQDANYVDGQEYVGYFNSKRCYTYPGYGSTPRTTTTFAPNSDYFTPTGDTNNSYHCNTTGTATGFSGNYLNYATMSAPDILRLALSGGNRGIDETARTVLDRGTIDSRIQPASFKLVVTEAIKPLVTPFQGAGIVYAYGCKDQVIFTTTNNSLIDTNCNLPSTSVDLRPGLTPTVITGSTTNTPTSGPLVSAGTAWVDTGNYTTVAPTAGPVASETVYTTTGALTAVPPLPAAESPAIVRTTSYVVSGTSTTPPIAAAETPAVIRGYFRTGAFTTTPPPAAAEPSPTVVWVTTTSGTPAVGVFSRNYQGSSAPVVTTNVTQNHYICHDNAAPQIIRRGPNTNNSGCGNGRTRFQYTSSNPANRVIYQNYTAQYRQYAPFYNAYNAVSQYYLYTSSLRYKVYELRTVWNVYILSAEKSIVKPRVLVCDATEGPTREIVYGTAANERYKYCTKYNSSGGTNYKPEGQIQQKSDTIRLSVMSYLIDGESRNGGVLRAPMKYTGPNKYDTNGNLVVNDEKEWDANTGIFVVKPITDSVSTGYTNTGVINYLNTFGKSGTYKRIDPVGELWYESLRYLQGLQPSDDATTGATEPMKDGYPVYTTWTDPITSACQRDNYILGIGDTNTHWDRTLPGMTAADQTALGSNQTGTDKTYSTTPTINGSTTALNAHDWTKLIDAFERGLATPLTYTDPLGRSQNTSGNSSPNTSLGNLDTTPTGAGSRSSYHWAGLAYWANTQPIRKDSIGTESMDKVRVKTFMIDVDENDQGSINANIQKTSFYLAGKYGYFNDLANDGKPFVAGNNSRWAEPDGSPRGYVLGSQPKRLIAGIARFFNESGSGGGSFAAVAVSSNSFSANSPDGKTYSPSFIPGQWSGTVKSFALGLNTLTNTLTPATTPTWDAGAILTLASRETGAVTLPQVKPADRKIVTYIDGTTPRGESFTYAATNNGADLPASFGQVPYNTTVADTLTAARIDYIRGDRTYELSEIFRPRQSIMGDIINSGPVFKGVPNEKITGDDYLDFFNANTSRTPVVYVGANDGMMHAFKASDGQELFAYIPGAVLDKLPRLTSKNYIHEAYVDAVPVVDEAKLSSGWKTILASGMGGGAQGVFVLDVTDPTTFNKDNVLFEFTDKNDAYMGNVVGQPQIVKMRDANSTLPAYKYFLVVSSGYNNYKNDGAGRFNANTDQALFFLDLNKATGAAWVENTNYFKVILPATSSATKNGLAQPGIRYGSAGEAIEFFSGDLQGNIWKVAFEKGINAAAVVDDTGDEFPIYKGGSGKKPLFTAKDAASNAQPITSSPVIYPTLSGGNMVVFGTGQLIESSDRSTTATQSIYGIWDSGSANARSYSLERAKLETLTMNTSTLVVSGGTPTFADNGSSKRGWYFDLTRVGERVIIDAVAGTGYVNINSTIPPSSSCSDNGDGLKYFLSPSSGKDVFPTEPEGGGYLGKSSIIEIDISTAVDSSYSTRGVTGRRTATKKEAISTPRGNKGGSTTNTTLYVNITYLATGRIYWREVRDFNKPV